MKVLSLADLKALSPKLPEKIPYLKMLVLFGSRARGDTHAKSDWDFAAIYDEEKRKDCIGDNGWAWFEVPQGLGEVFKINSDEIDVVELNRCSSLIAHFVARDGKLIYESEPGEFDKFKQNALMSESELKQIERDLRNKIDEFLKEWGLA
ncbi:nucleotidyltransferase domain-containing protein [Microseira sp. BLCC-F43]|jgi:predicted nucleotidyltransferase|uniref:type VII toxin-antitoxin system MntA family adenylyltransferase antitoxin n=1 Tax=Microseira sp. BLCC-F43 TaxID=3153602 RepID=UPI0035B84739